MRALLSMAGAAIALSIAAGHGTAVAASEAEAFSVPFEFYKGHIFVSALVNGQGPYRFGFDTGASGMGRSDAALTAALSLPKVAETANSDGIKVATADVVSVKSLRLGNLERRDVRLLSRDYNRGRKAGEEPLMGIIARDFFADWLVTINYPARTISFKRGELRPGDEGVVPYGPSLRIPVCFASGCYVGKVDTGLNRSLVVPKDLVAKLSASAPVSIGQVMRTNSSATLYEMSLLEPVRVGGVTATGQKLVYTEPSDTAIVVGSEFLRDYELTIDQRHQLLRIGKPAL